MTNDEMYVLINGVLWNGHYAWGRAELKGLSSEMDAILFLHHSIGLPLTKACAAKTQTFIKGTVCNEH